MKEEHETLLALAASGELDAKSAARWKQCCAEHPELEEELRLLQRTMKRVRGTVEAADARARAEAPAEIPPYILTRLETARKEVFGSTPAQESGLKRFFAWLTEITTLPAPLLAAAAVVLVAAVGWWAMQPRGTGPTLATVPGIFKDAVASPDLPLISPDVETALTDPTVAWFTLSREPVSVTIFDAAGNEVASAESTTGRAEWSGLETNQPGLQLRPGDTCLVRLAQGGVISERVVKVRGDATTLDEAAAAADALDRARAWMESGRPGDAFSLAGRLAATKSADLPADALRELRERALQAALEAGDAAPEEK